MGIPINLYGSCITNRNLIKNLYPEIVQTWLKNIFSFLTEIIFSRLNNQFVPLCFDTTFPDTSYTGATDEAELTQKYFSLLLIFSPNKTFCRICFLSDGIRNKTYCLIFGFKIKSWILDIGMHLRDAKAGFRSSLV